LDQLNGLGFSKNSVDTNSSKMTVPVSPYKVRMANNDVLKDNYEVLVSRVCKMESTVQSLKLSLLNIQGNPSPFNWSNKFCVSSSATERRFSKTSAVC
jgi:hypothetical protein